MVRTRCEILKGEKNTFAAYYFQRKLDRKGKGESSMHISSSWLLMLSKRFPIRKRTFEVVWEA